MIAAIPVCEKDIEAVERNLKWIASLDKKIPHGAIISSDSKECIDRAYKLAETVFEQVGIYFYDPYIGDVDWPRPQNYAFQSFARRYNSCVLPLNIQKANEREILRKPWLWWESDAVPVRKGWLDAIAKEHEQGGKPFSGHIVEGMGHMNGVAVYPWNLNEYSSNVFICRAGPFDIMLKHDVSPDLIHPMNAILQHLVGAPHTNIFPDAKSLSKINASTVLFHRCKDGQLIERLKNGDTKFLGCKIDSSKGQWELSKFDCAASKIAFKTKQVSSKRPHRIIHCVERHKQSTPDAFRRVSRAVDSWLNLYLTGDFIPAHYWNYKRSSESVGDARKLPYLKDVLEFGSSKARNDDDIVMITNDDTILHPELGNVLFEFMAKTPACCSGRVNFKASGVPAFNVNYSDDLYRRDIGRDLFAFRKSFLDKNMDAIPDFMLGELEWDLVMSAFIRRKVAKKKTTLINRLNREPSCELPMGCVFHEDHVKAWQDWDARKSESKKHNVMLMNAFFVKEKMEELIAVRPEQL